MKRVVLKWGIVCFLLLGMVSLGSTKPLRAAAATQIKIDKKTFP